MNKPELQFAIGIIKTSFPILNNSEIQALLERDFSIIASIDEIECINMELDEEVEMKLLCKSLGY